MERRRANASPDHSLATPGRQAAQGVDVKDPVVAFLFGMLVSALVVVATSTLTKSTGTSPNVPNLILEQRTSPGECVRAPGGTRTVRFYGDW
jgi:UDP-N-acetylglucosamine:LPS N-acetylglucosamine transferase